MPAAATAMAATVTAAMATTAMPAATMPTTAAVTTAATVAAAATAAGQLDTKLGSPELLRVENVERRQAHVGDFFVVKVRRIK